MEIEKLSIRRMAIAIGILFAASMMAIGFWNVKHPSYGQPLLDTLGSIYPFYGGQEGTFLSVFLLGIVGFFHGAISGFLFAVVYNFSKKRHHYKDHLTSVGNERKIEKSE